MKDQTTIDEQPAPIKKRKPRYWIWILVGVTFFILVVSWINRAAERVEIQQGRFGSMVTQRVIKRIVLVPNQMIVEVTLKPKSLQNVVYRAELEQINAPFGIEPNGPHYAMRIASVDQFYRDYEEATELLAREDRLDIEVDDRHDVIGIIMNWLFLGFIVFVMVMLAKLFSRLF